jgi:hypothetical protein
MLDAAQVTEILTSLAYDHGPDLIVSNATSWASP